MKDFLSQVRYRKSGEYCVVRFIGSLDTVYREPLLMFFADRLKEGLRYFIIDLAKTDYMSSTIWGALITVAKRVRENGGDIYLCGIHGQVGTVFKILQLNRIIETYPDVYKAIENLGIVGFDIE